MGFNIVLRDSNDRVDETVAVSGDVMVVGARKDDDNGSSSGSAYVFRFIGSAWIEEQKLLAFDGGAYDVFGDSVAVCGDVAVIGARGDAVIGGNSGSAYVFCKSGSNVQSDSVRIRIRY